MTDFLLLGFDIVGFIVALGMAYYAFHMVDQMKSGRLEKSWKYMTRGALVIAIDAVVLMIQVFGSASNTVVVGTTYVGFTFAIIGGFLMMLGFREHYLVWNTKLPLPSKKDDKSNGKKASQKSKDGKPAIVSQTIKN